MALFGLRGGEGGRKMSDNIVEFKCQLEIEDSVGCIEEKQSNVKIEMAKIVC